MNRRNFFKFCFSAPLVAVGLARAPKYLPPWDEGGYYVPPEYLESFNTAMRSGKRVVFGSMTRCVYGTPLTPEQVVMVTKSMGAL